MGKKRFKYLSLVLCIVFICGSIVYIPKKNDVKAFFPALAGPAVVLSIMISMGFIVTSENAQRMATDIYNGLDSNLKSIADIKGQGIPVGGQMTYVDMPRAQYDAFVQAIMNKFGWGTNPPTTWQDTPYGQCLSSTSGYSSVTSPYDVKTSKPLFNNLLGSGTWNTTYGGFQYKLVASTPGSNYIEVTCPDGFKFRDIINVYCQNNYTTGFTIYAPCIYSSGSATPDIKFFGYSAPGTYVPGGALNRGDVYIESVPGSGNFNTYCGSNAGPYMKSHLGTYNPPSAAIDQQAYLDAVNGIGQSVEDMSLNMSTDMDKMIMYNAETVKSIDNVNSSVINLGGTITSAFQAVGTSIVNGVNAITTGISTTATNIYTGVQSIATSITAAPTVALNMQPLSLAGATLATKFPFCIPFDLVNSISALNVAAVAPHWIIKFDSAYFTGGGQVDIDFVQFEAWAVIIRWGLLIGFSLGLIMITRQIIGGE